LNYFKNKKHHSQPRSVLWMSASLCAFNCTYKYTVDFFC
jgi:hypothetical protein